MKGTSIRTGKGTRPKRELTRERIMAAARAVFAHHPYHSASMRMIGRAGKFDHALIRYHFPTKAGLFGTLLGEVCEELVAVNRSCLEGLTGIPLDKALARYLDRFLDFHFKDPAALRIIMLNIALADRPDAIPGYRRIPEVLTRTRATFEEALPVPAPPGETARYHYAFNNLLINFLGAGSCQMIILGMKGRDEEYRAWVKETMTYLFLPPLKRLAGENG
ncbi:MAG: TetR/AcrR family transcriptional regulator [Spirochaetes bacterium]|nr:MAG: TetR/AcrR family transcriptional regulator [Spirochaetota bacterium]